jgi:hypothetical protein
MCGSFWRWTGCSSAAEAVAEGAEELVEAAGGGRIGIGAGVGIGGTGGVRGGVPGIGDGGGFTGSDASAGAIPEVVDAFEGTGAIFDKDVPAGGAVFDAVEAEGEIALDVALDMGGFVALAAGTPGEDAEVIEVVIDVAGGEGGPEPDGFELTGTGGDLAEGVVGGDAGAFGVLGDFLGNGEVEEGGEDPTGAAIGGADEGP